jgi:UDP-N-acetyl-D-galactosamine dehydrogenase
MIRKRQPVNGAKVLILGLTFKENCPDLRNTRVVDLLSEFQSYGVHVDIHDPWADPEEAMHEYGLSLIHNLPKSADYQALVLAVAHDQYRDMGIEALRLLGVKDAVVYDIKGLFGKDAVDARL